MGQQLQTNTAIQRLLVTVQTAAKTLTNVAITTPLLESELLNQQLGMRILFKPECLQRTGSFKFRGAYFKISQLSETERQQGIIAYSSGNHAQGVAKAATMFAAKSVVIMPADAPQIKIKRTQAFGAEVVLYNRYEQIREDLAIPYIDQGYTLVPPYDDWDIIAGQATIGREIIEDLQTQQITPDVLYCPVGGGGLIAGVSAVLKANYPQLDVIGVEPRGHDDTAKSLIKGERVKNAGFVPTLCDAIVTPTPGEKTFQINQQTLSHCEAVGNNSVLQAMRLIRDELKLIVEPTGASGLAALLNNKSQLQGKTVVIVLSGGNIDSALQLGD